MSNYTINSATITPVLAAGSVASPYVYQVNISQRLCNPTCAAQTPVFNPSFTLLGYTSMGNGVYVAMVHVEGIISYVPCNGSVCCTKSQVLSQNFTIPFYSGTAPTSVSISAGSSVNAIAVSACQSCSRNFVSETPMTLSVA